MNEPIFRLSGIRRRYRQGANVLDVLRGADLTLAPGEIVALVGPSGAGKSTLLHIAGLLERPDSGSVRVDGTACDDLGDDARTGLRRSTFGFVYQYHHLLPEFSALENVSVPQAIARVGASQARKRSRYLLDRLGLGDRADHRPGQLSGGEQQRVAIARALANGPKILLADEPTGNLDPHTADRVFALLLELAREANLAAVVATHNADLAGRLDRAVRLREGILVSG